VDFDAAFSISVVRNQSQFSKLVHKKAHPERVVPTISASVS